MADRQLLAGQRDVDDLVAQAAVELLVLEQLLALGDGGLEALADAVQEHAGLAVADAAERLGELALAAQVADARVIELTGATRSGNRGARLALVRLPVHGGDCNFVCGQESSSFVGAGWSGPGSEREVRRREPGSRFRSGAW